MRHETKPDDPITIDIEYELLSMKTTEVNYKYLVMLMQMHVPDEDTIVAERIEDKVVDKYIQMLAKENPLLAGVVGQIWQELQDNPAAFAGRHILTVIDERVPGIIARKLRALAAKWALDADELVGFPYRYRREDIVGLVKDYAAYKAAGGTLSKLRYNHDLRDAVQQVVEQEILPLLEK